MNKNIGKFFFRYRNILGPLLLILALLLEQPSYPLGRSDLNIAFDVAGVIIALMGQALRIVTIGYEYIERGGKNRQVYASKLIQGGVFAHCRNPLYVGNILMAVGFAFIVHSYAFHLIVVPFIIFVYGSIVAAEEDFLRNKFGEEYNQYCRRVNRWLPRWKGWSSSIAEMRFNWSRVLVKEYNTFFLLILALMTSKLWSEFRIIGAAALPAIEFFLVGLVGWLVLYILVRSLKKTGVVKG
ncbi:isoprenylcysteine carboxylmethyltransferase family protein [Diaphorobacter sp. J5-51]|uniref:methyltransferase family protein n=1 Tax=Diaphorobacter sp. J5-51 TaxID=680496 RepID=UPI000642C89D|nr:isoprenylcysteine carboxylmethyltransferase family protein [Diaphorobacter sp. J5-51]KLR57044.1 hypothetical protein OX89_14650 [Diaphorobacter sp. J5-51]